MPRPSQPPIGRHLAQVAKLVSRAFDDALSAVGGSRPQWLILISLKSRPTASQRQLADALGIEGATLSQQLGTMEADGLLTRRRDPANRRVHLVELTNAGEQAFQRLRRAAGRFDQQLRGELADDDLATLRRLLDQLRRNVATDPSGPDEQPTAGAPQDRT